MSTTPTSDGAGAAALNRQPILRVLSADLLARIDTSELLPGHGAHEATRRRLEASLDAYVVAYRARHPTLALTLCRLIEPISLSPDEVAGVRAAEAQHPGVAFVAYVRPLRMRETVA